MSEQGLRARARHPVGGDLNVLVLGMHRTGTSAVAGVLRAAGLYAGNDDELVGRLAANPDGFVERPDVVDLDDRLLEALGWAWDTPDPEPMPVAPPLDELVAAGRALVSQQLAAAGRTWVLKDPRMSLLLPWWRRILLDRFVAVVTVREPAEAAWSLSIRDGFTAELGLALWSAYYRHLAAGLEGLAVVSLDYGRLTEQPETVVPQLLDELQRLGVAGPFDQEAALSAVRSVLRRPTQPDVELGPLSESLGHLREAWLREPLRVQKRFEYEAPAPDRWERAILAGHRIRRQLESALAEVQESREQLTVGLDDAIEQADALRDELSAAKAEQNSLARRAQQLGDELEATRRRQHALEAELQTGRAQGEALEHFAKALEAAGQELESTRQELGAVRGELVSLSHNLDQAQQSAQSKRGRRATSPRDLGRAVRTLMLRGAVRLIPQTALARLWHNPLFDAAWYAERYQDIGHKRMHAEQHFRRHGAGEGRRPNELFDTTWYLSRYQDVAKSGLNPLDHYLLFGALEGRDPGPKFSTSWYLEHHPDVAETRVNPLLHYLRYGRLEGRSYSDRGPGSSTGERVSWAQPGAALLGSGPASAPGASASGRRAVASRTSTTGLMLHLYHTDLWPEIRNFIDSLDEVRLFVSLTHETGDGFDEQIRADYPDADVRFFPNRGRDMGPFIELLREGAFDGCDLVCKIHSKRSPHRVDGDDWRRRLLGELLGSPHVVGHVRRRFEEDAELGLLGPADALTDSDEYWGSNRDRVYELGARMGRPEEDSKLNFFAGSMFWFRPSALHPLRTLELSLDDFEPEAGQVDGTLAHALERAIPVSVKAAGLKLEAFETPGRAARRGVSVGDRTVKLVAFYLPQFHPVPENDGWWGPGFTEWAQVARSRPLYAGHPQPRLPAQLGFYDLRVPEVRQAQADLAADHGIHGFCYYFYWFNGRRVLDRPLTEVLRSGEPDFPFLICWANENWTRRWDGLDHDILLAQQYSADSHRQFIRDVIPILRDPRYVRYQGKPVLVIYRIRDIPDVRGAVELWREECRRAGVGEIHLAAVRFWDVIDVTSFGFDAAVDFPPHHVAVRKVHDSLPGLVSDFSGLAYDYEHVVRENLRTMGHGYDTTAHRGVMLAWDNTPRRGTAAHFAHGATPELYGRWLGGVIEQEMEHNQSDESLIFVNAWNEWAEGANLEPDTVFGDGFLRATREQVTTLRQGLSRRAT
jgi:lipopolysaccharide biosynthesis protein